MNDWIFPIFLIAEVPKSQRGALAEQVLSAVVPGPSSQRLALAVIGAERQLNRQAKSDQSLLEEAVRAAGFDRPDQLADFPALNAVFKRLPPAAQAAMFPRANAPQAAA